MPGFRRISPLFGPGLLRRRDCLIELEDGSGFLELENGQGVIALETCNQAPPKTFLIELEDGTGAIELENGQGLVELEVGP